MTRERLEEFHKEQIGLFTPEELAAVVKFVDMLKVTADLEIKSLKEKMRRTEAFSSSREMARAHTIRDRDYIDRWEFHISKIEKLC